LDWIEVLNNIWYVVAGIVSLRWVCKSRRERTGRPNIQNKKKAQVLEHLKGRVEVGWLLVLDDRRRPFFSERKSTQWAAATVASLDHHSVKERHCFTSNNLIRPNCYI